MAKRDFEKAAFTVNGFSLTKKREQDLAKLTKELEGLCPQNKNSDDWQKAAIQAHIPVHSFCYQAHRKYREAFNKDIQTPRNALPLDSPKFTMIYEFLHLAGFHDLARAFMKNPNYKDFIANEPTFVVR